MDKKKNQKLIFWRSHVSSSNRSKDIANCFQNRKWIKKSHAKILRMDKSPNNSIIYKGTIAEFGYVIKRLHIRSQTPSLCLLYNGRITLSQFCVF